MVNIRRMVFFALLSGLPLWAAGCAGNFRTVLYNINDKGRLEQKTLDRVLWENQPGEDDNVTSTVLLKNDLSSYHLIQIRDSEKPHKHEFHDVAVFFQTGYGTLHLGAETLELSPGAIVFIPHGTPHYFENKSSQPSAVIAVFSPAYDGQDSVDVDMKAYLRLRGGKK